MLTRPASSPRTGWVRRRKRCACRNGCRLSCAHPVFGDGDDGAQAFLHFFLARSVQPLLQHFHDMSFGPPIDEDDEAEPEAPFVFGVEPVQLWNRLRALFLERTP